ncbi:MAG: Ppx/GppA family phosphatase, partial [Bdellovibrionales bacterium]|nr:Ppx/GppA family phosphatase [Bdellovibrionales bacterium]
GQDLNKTKKLHPDALERARVCLAGFKKEIDQFKPEKILAFATSAARDAENNQEFFELCSSLGIPVSIITGNNEALATYRGVFWGQIENTSYNLLIDIGGGSTEIILGSGMNLIESTSIDVGAVRMTEKWITKYPISQLQKNHLKEDVVQKLSSYLGGLKEYNINKVYAVAGTPTTLAAATMGGVFDADRIEGYTFTLGDLENWENKLSKATVSEIINDLHIPKGRADIIYSGVVILRLILKTIKFDKVIVSTKGVRFGVVASQFLG